MPGPAVEWPAWRTPAAASRRPPVTSTTHRLHAWIVSWSHRGGIVPVEELAGNLDVDAVYGFIRRLFTGYTRTLPAYRRRLLERFTLTRVARKVVGVGSVGTEAWILLMEPDDGVEPLLLQAKQSQRSVLADYAGQSEYHNQGERVVAGQQLMQAVSDIFLGWQSATPPGRRSADPVRKISIIPRGQALGVTYQAPEADRYGYSETYLRGRITGTLGGRAAEEVIYGDVTTGAENDMEHASAIARQMVGRRGKSPAIGPVSVLPSSGQESSTGTDGVAPATKELIDTETRRIIGECYQQAVETLRGSRDRLDRLAHTLLDRETLDEDEAHAAAGISRDTAPATGARAAARLVTARTPPVRKNLLPNGRGFTPRPGADTSAWPGGPVACSASGLLSLWPAGPGGMPRVRVRAAGAATPAWPRGRSGRPRRRRRWRPARSARAGR